MYHDFHVFYLHPDTTQIEVEQFIAEHNINNAKIEQLPSKRPNEYASYKISVPQEYYNLIKTYIFSSNCKKESDPVISMENSKKYDILCINVQSIKNKIGDIESLCITDKYDVLCIIEHWLNAIEASLLNIDGYITASYFSRTQYIHGGSIIMLRKSLNNVIIDVNNFSVEKDFEICGINIPEINLIILSLYRSPSGNFNIFIEQLNLVLSQINVNNKNEIISGDYNNNFLFKESNYGLC